jgi:hypothetical protein
MPGHECFHCRQWIEEGVLLLRQAEIEVPRSLVLSGPIADRPGDQEGPGELTREGRAPRPGPSSGRGRTSAHRLAARGLRPIRRADGCRTRGRTRDGGAQDGESGTRLREDTRESRDEAHQGSDEEAPRYGFTTPPNTTNPITIAKIISATITTHGPERFLIFSVSSIFATSCVSSARLIPLLMKAHRARSAPE